MLSQVGDTVWLVYELISMQFDSPLIMMVKSIVMNQLLFVGVRQFGDYIASSMIEVRLVSTDLMSGELCRVLRVIMFVVFWHVRIG